MDGYVHSIESMGLVDGPGIRVVVFLQGCSLRCQFCHNPDTWEMRRGEKMSSGELVRRVERFRAYFERSGGGVTFSGGEPLCQPAFLLSVLRLCREKGIHTCLDTAGVGLGEYREILLQTDLVLYDVKHHDPERYFQLTGRSMMETERFLETAKQCGTKLWIRHVVVPGLTDSKEHMQSLRGYIQALPNVERVELLPYHLLGFNKYETMGIPYALANIPAMDTALCEKLQKEFFSEWTPA